MPNRDPARLRSQGGFGPGVRVGSLNGPATVRREEWSPMGLAPGQNPAYRPSAAFFVDTASRDDPGDSPVWVDIRAWQAGGTRAAAVTGTPLLGAFAPGVLWNDGGLVKEHRPGKASLLAVHGRRRDRPGRNRAWREHHRLRRVRRERPGPQRRRGRAKRISGWRKPRRFRRALGPSCHGAFTRRESLTGKAYRRARAMMKNESIFSGSEGK